MAAFPNFPQLPDDDPVEALQKFRQYLRDIMAYCSPKWIIAAVMAIVLVPTLAFVVAWALLGLDSTLSWASDFVPLGFAFAGIAFSIRKVRDDYHYVVIAMIAIVGIMGTVVLHIERIREAARLYAATNINQELLNTQSNPRATPLSPQQAAVQRMENIYKALRGEYILSHQNISPGLLAGNENPPNEWMNKRLGQLGENWRFSEPATKAETPTHAVRPVALPLVDLKFTNAPNPVVTLINTTSALAKNIKWSVVLWNLDRPDEQNPLQIPTQLFDFIKGHSEGGPELIFNSGIASSLKKGDRLLGSATVDCEECSVGKTYVVSVVWGVGGWYSEFKGAGGKTVLPLNPISPSALSAYSTALEAAVPASDRIPIQ